MEGDFETYYLTTHKNDSDMKGTDHFKRTIYMYLEQRAEEDALFAKKYRNPAKNIDECVTHILNHVMCIFTFVIENLFHQETIAPFHQGLMTYPSAGKN